MNLIPFLIYLVIMAGSTYLIRALPFACMKKQIKNPYIKAFLDYIPYSVLAAMTFPAILYSTTYVLAAAAGFVTALILAYFKQSMVRVAIASCVTVYLVEAGIRLFIN